MNEPWFGGTLKHAAYYHAGHAVVAIGESLGVELLSIADGEGWIDVTCPNLTQSYLSRSVTARSDAKSVIRALLAGPISQSRYSFGTVDRDNQIPDFDLSKPDMIANEAVWRAISIAGKISKDSPSLIQSLWWQVSRLINGNEVWPAIEAVAQSLLDNGELAGCEVHDIVQFAIDRGTF